MADNNLDEVIRNMSRWRQQHQDQEEEKAERYRRIEEHYARIHALLKKKLEKGFVQPPGLGNQGNEEDPKEVDGDIPTPRELGQIQDKEESYIASRKKHGRRNVVENWSAVKEPTRDLGIVWDYEVERKTY